MHVVPPPMTGNYMPLGPDVEVDDYKFTYGPKQTKPSESESQSSECDTCESNISTEPFELVSEQVVIESNVESQPKVWSDAPIIEEYQSDSDDEYVSVKIKDLDTPSFAIKQIKNSRKNLKNQSTKSQKPMVNNKEVGIESNEKACFVCGSFSHLIRDCDYHVKLAKQNELHKQNHFVPLAVQTRTGTNPVNTAKASSTNKVRTARQSINRQTVQTSTALKINTVKPMM
ncbi:hypothetical protein Tco_1250122, partial [Tanacetum coccineum]